MRTITVEKAINKMCPFVFDSHGSVSNCTLNRCMAWQVGKVHCSCGAYGGDELCKCGEKRKLTGVCLRLHNE